MKYKTLFRIMLKVIGVYLIANGLTQFLLYGFSAFRVWRATTALSSSADLWEQLGYAVFSVVPNLIIGGYLFFDGKWVADKAIPGNRPYCHECGYDLTGTEGNVCVECGTPFRPAQAIGGAHGPTDSASA